jgi:hypothetical protein
MIRTLYFAAIALTLSSTAFAAKKMDKVFPDQVKVDGKELKLNALGVRRVSQFGIPVKVYVGGFYVKTPTKDAEAMLKMEMPVYFRMVFLLSAGADKVTAAWDEAFDKTCKTDCDKAKKGLKECVSFLTTTWSTIASKKNC